MPRRLLDRCRPDSIREFRAAAQQRFHEAMVLSSAGRRTGAIYLWGYTAEMILKAAYFSLIGMAETAAISVHANIMPSVDRGRRMGIVWPGQGAGHNPRAWAELLVAERALSPATAFPTSLGLDVQRYGQRIEQLWRETLRYHKNFAYQHEVRQVREAAEWFVCNAHRL